MTDVFDTPLVEADSESTEKKVKKGQRPKKRPSDFEITRTILQRTNERKLPMWLKNMGEDSDLILLCSAAEDQFLYGSSAMTCLLVQFDDPEVETICHSVLSKLHGYAYPNQILINIRDQISALGKTKGESITEEVLSNEFGANWVIKRDVNGKESTLNYSFGIESLFHFQDIQSWCREFRPLLTATSDTAYVYPYTHPDSATTVLLTVPPMDNPDNPISALYPNGFRASVTRGIDVLISKSFEDHFPYPVISEELIFYVKDGAVAQMAHRIIGTGWRMILVRPNSVIFPMARDITSPIEHGGL